MSAENTSIYLHHVIPDPLSDSVQHSEVWNKEIQFKRGGKYLIKAQSGKGKSTLLHIIYGIRKDFKGSVKFNTSTLPQIGDTELSIIRSKNMSILFQDLRLFSQLSGLENILLKPGCNLSETEIEDMARKLNVSDRLKNLCGKLSLGQQQRIAIIRALSQNYHWLLLDEPISHLDHEHAARAMELIMSDAESKNAGIVITSLGETQHYPDFTMIEL